MKRLNAPLILALALTAAPGPSRASDAPRADLLAQGDSQHHVKIPLYWEREITATELEGRSLRELSLMRNTIYARTGNTFHTPWLRDYFAAQPWYRSREEPDVSILTPIDTRNAEAIGRFEVSLTKEQLRSRVAKAAEAHAASPSTTTEVELRLLSKALGTWVAPTEVTTRSPLEDPSQLDRLLVLAELESMSRRDLRLVRNTVYARRGREFRSEVLTMHFYQTEWYEPDPGYSDGKLTSIDQKNIRLVLSVEQQHGGPLQEWEHRQEVEFFFGA